MKKIIISIIYCVAFNLSIHAMTYGQAQSASLYLTDKMAYELNLSVEQFEAAYAPFYPNFNHDQFVEYLRELELDKENGYMDKLSHGQKKKVLIAFALATNTKVLFMDESRLVIISTHQVRDLHSLIDMVAILDNGHMLLNASSFEITEKLLFDVDNMKSAEGKIFYSEESPRGNYQVKENVNHLESSLDLELLFNAAITNKNEIANLFK